MSLSLYQLTLLDVLHQIDNGIISQEALIEKLPQDIIDELNSYLDLPTVEERFYKSLYWQHFLISDYFLNKIIDKKSVINDGLSFAKNKKTADYLISLGANDFNYGLLGAVYQNNKIMINFYIDHGADDWNSALYQAANTDNIKLINYFIERGATDFDAALLGSIHVNNEDMIKFFISKGATDWNSAMIEAVKSNNTKLTEDFINRGATDFDTGLIYASKNGNIELLNYFKGHGANTFTESLAVAIESDHNEVIDLLIKPISVTSKFNPIVLGDVLLYFFMNAEFETYSGVKISDLIPLTMDGFTLLQTAEMLMRLYLLNKQINSVKYTGMYDLINETFRNMPSYYQIVRKHDKWIKQSNRTNSSTFDNIKIMHPAFTTSHIDSLYFDDIIFLNSMNSSDFSQKIIDYVYQDDVVEQLWKEYQIILAVISTYDDILELIRRENRNAGNYVHL